MEDPFSVLYTTTYNYNGKKHESNDEYPPFSFIIPVYNDEKRLNFVLKKINDFRKDYFCEIIIVDDGSLDDTYKVASGFDTKIVRNDYNLGFWGSVLKGIELSSKEIIQIYGMNSYFPDSKFCESIGSKGTNKPVSS